MERSNKSMAQFTKRFGRSRAGRSGKITLVTLVAILGLIVLAGFVGNAGHVVTAKVASQNAADAIAFSSAQWMARGMNAVTATNHLVGEVTGLVVIVEALGGPEADAGLEDYPIENKSVDMINQKLKDSAVIKGGYGASAFSSADKAFLKVAVGLISPEDEKKAKHKAFATIYDSKRLLKRDLRKRLIIKTIANAGFFVPPPFGWATMAAAYIAHAASNYEIAKDVKEYLILEGFEILVTKLEPIKVGIFENRLIPALAKHGDLLAGHQLNTGPIRTSVVNAGLIDSLDRLGKTYDVDAAIYPGATAWTLPIDREPEPSTNRGSRDQNEQPGWGTDELAVESTDDLISDLKESIEDQKDEIEKRQFFLAQELGPKTFLTQDSIAELEKEIDDVLDSDPKSPLKEKVLAEKEEIRKLKEIKIKRIQELSQQSAQLDREFEKMKGLIEEAGSVVNIPGNLSIKGIPQDKMNQKEERYTQWVRATYPYVDAFRAPIINKFKENLENSKAAEHYQKWTNRYTLVKAWQFRSGFRFKGEKGSSKPGTWTKDPNDRKSQPLTMYVMKGAYPQPRPGSRDRKGLENWTKDTKEGKREAEQLYTVVSMTNRELEPLFSPVLFSNPTEGGITTFAQAIFYNGNKQTPAKADEKLKFQADLGWDTLNWTPGAKVPEWGADPTKAPENVEEWPWTAFDSSDSHVNPAKVKLNWQAKLMPVTQSRFIEASAASSLTPNISGSMFKALPFFDPLVTH